MIDQELEKFIKQSLKEDIRTGDHTSLACIDKENSSPADEHDKYTKVSVINSRQFFSLHNGL